MRSLFRVAWWAQAGLLLLPRPVAAQARLGDLSTSLSGTVSAGYTADYGNMTSSSHGFTLGGEASLNGSYHDPNFLSFNLNAYLNQSRANSSFQSVSDASGFDLSTNIFAGSHYPGSMNYSYSYNSDGSYAIPGIANYVTHGNNRVFGINWSENLPDEPSLSVGFQTGHSAYSVYGTNDQGNNAFHSLNLHSSYTLAGFNMGAYYVNGGSTSLIPQVVAGPIDTETHSDNSGYGFNFSHMLPLHGSFSAGFNRSDYDSDYLGFHSGGTIDMVNALASVHPTYKLGFSGSMNYSDNLSGQLYQAIIGAGGVTTGVNSNESSDSLDVMGVGSYTIRPDVQTSAFVERRTQNYLGETFGVTSYGGSASYARELLKGSFNSSVSASANHSDNTGADTLGFSTIENYSSEFKGWHVTGAFGYGQNVQTLLVTYMNSFYNFSGNVRRNWGQFNFSAGAGASRSALTGQAGPTYDSETYNAGLGYAKWITATGSYSRSNGQALATGGGLVPIPIPPPALPSNLVSLYGGDSYSVGLSSTPVKRLVIAGTYAKSNSSTTNTAFTSSNQNNEANVLVQYRLRKLYFTSGYARLEQGFSQTGTQPEIISSYYIGVSRWFNFF
jgi:hypothetical protein